MLSIPISKTKIIPPRRRAELLTRKRLLDMLFEFLEKKLILLSAPAGYGKTSLLIDLANQSEMPCCWLSLDELDRDPQRFIAYLIAALSEKFPNFGRQSLAVLNEATSLEQDLEKVLIALVNEAYEHIQEHFILVLDDFHLMEDAQFIQAFLNRFIQLVDENCHIIIASRVLSSLPDLPLMVAREQVSGLSFAELAFHPEELQSLLLQNHNLRISDEDARKMAEDTEGWITGLQFTGAGILLGSMIRPSSGTGVGLFDYLGQQVLDRQPRPLREFLQRTSLLDEFDAALCQAVLAASYSEPQNWQEMIDAIIKNNLFALPVGADGRSIRYHHLFRDFLRTRLEREHPEEIRTILSRLAGAYEKLGEWERAHYICRQLGDGVALAEIVERSSTTMLQRAHLTLESWLKDLAPSLLRTRPGLLAIRGALTCLKGNLRDGLSLLDQAEQIFRNNDDISGLTLALARRATAHRFLGNYEASLRDADEVISLTDSGNEYQMFYAEALRVKGLALYRLGRAGPSVEVLEQSLALYTRMNDTSLIPVLTMETGMVYHAIGNYEQAGRAYESALEIWRKEGNLSWQANLLNNLGVLHQFQGEYEKAALALEEGMICAQRSGYVRMEALIAIGLGDLYAELEDIAVAQQNYRHAEVLIRGMEDQFLLHFLALAQVALALAQREGRSARELIETVSAAILSGGSLNERGLFSLARGRLSLLEEDYSQAIAEFEDAADSFLQGGQKLEEAASHIWLAAAYHKAGNQALARQMIKSVIDSRGQVTHTVLVVIHQAREWLQGLQKDAMVGRAVANLFNSAGQLAARIPSARRQLRRQARVVQIPTSHLTIQAFGRAVVRIGGRPLTIADWQTQSVRDLFFYFLTVNKPLTKEQIGVELWPDVDEPSKLRLRFKNEIYRLRRAVGQEVILFEDDHYQFNHAMDYEYDVEAFRSYLDGVKATTSPKEQIELYQKAVDLVRGPFLEDIYADWASVEREYLGQAYVTALLILADLFQKQAQLEKALKACQRALDYDPTLEAAYLLSMQIYHRLGDRASIIRTYQACVDAMQRLLGLPPSEEMEELYRRLID